MSIFRNIEFNLNDLNFILTLAGFPIVTTLLPFVPSVPYRAFALGVALICLLKNGLHFSHEAKLMKWFLIILFLVDFKILLQIIFAGADYQQSAFSAFLFVFGVTLLPSLAVFSGFYKIHWETVLWITWILLSAVLIVGDITIRMTAFDLMNSERMDLNERQSTLALADNGGYLIIIASSLLFSFRKIENKFLQRIIFCLIIISLIAGVWGQAKAASRGPVLSMVVGLLFISACMQSKNRTKVIILLSGLILIFGINMNTLSNFAPLLFDRFTNTVENGDLSGRDVLFKEAWDLIINHPILGDDPLLFFPHNDFYTGYHNGFLSVGVALGLWGFAIYIILVMATILKGYKCRNEGFVSIDYFMYGMLGFCIMRSMSGASISSTPEFAMIFGLSCIYFSNNNFLLIRNYEHTEV